MKTDDARRVLAAAKARAADLDKTVSIAIVDAGGSMVLFERLGDAPALTALAAEGKAAGSAFTGMDSARLVSMAKNLPALGARLAGQRFVALQGGVPIFDDGAVIGAIGVSGSSGEEDEEIARAGAEAFASGEQVALG